MTGSDKVEDFIEVDLKAKDSHLAILDDQSTTIMKSSETFGSYDPVPHSSLKDQKSKNVTSSIDIQSSDKDNFLIRFMKNRTEGLTGRQVLIMVVFAFVEFFAATVISIQAPFFPEIASLKGASATEYGLVFGIFELTVFIMSPIFGAKMNSFGPKLLFNVGIFTTGFCCVIFGFLNYIDGRFLFIASCLVVRCIEAIGDAAFVTASFTIIALEFPDSVATTFATMETFYGLGMIFGPVIGAVLYEIGGYSLPFGLMGGLLFISAVVTHFLLPEIGKSKSKEEGKEKLVTTSGFGMFKMLRIPVISMVAFSIVAIASGVGFLSATLEPHLRQFDLSKFTVGAVFVLNGGVYALTAPGWGWICDHIKQPKYITLIGSIFTILGFLLIGPVPFLPFDTTLWMICTGLVLFGLGLGATLVSAFIQVLKDSIDRGYPDDVSTYGLVSGLWTSMTALGFCIGPVGGGVLYDLVGFRWGSLFVLAGQFILIGFLAVYFLKIKVASSNYEIGMSDVTTTNRLKRQLSQKNSTDTVIINEVVNTGASNTAYVKEDEIETSHDR